MRWWGGQEYSICVSVHVCWSVGFKAVVMRPVHCLFAELLLEGSVAVTPTVGAVSVFKVCYGLTSLRAITSVAEPCMHCSLPC